MSDRELALHPNDRESSGSLSPGEQRTPSESPKRRTVSPYEKTRSHSPRDERLRSRSRSAKRYRSRSRSYERSRGDKHYKSRSRSPGHKRSRKRSHSRSRSPHKRSRRDRSRSCSPMSSRRRHMGSRENPKENRCIGVFGLSLHTTERDLRDAFSRFGPIDDLQIVYDHQTGRSRGFAFMYYRNTDDAAEAKEHGPGMEIDGRKVRVDFSITERAHTPTPGIYLGKPTSEGRAPYRGSGRDYGGGGGGRRGGGGGGGYYRSRRSPSPGYYREDRGYYRERRSRSRSYTPPRRY